MRQAQALAVMMRGDSVFLTGAPGAGKTYVLNQFISLAKRAGKTVAVTASTGIAATHIGGTTIHSWSGLGIKDTLTQWDVDKLKSSSKYVKRYNATDILVIDEVSMLHGARLDMVNLVAKAVRQNPAPFGGMQVVLVGDLFQLPPVSRDRTEADFVHLSAAWAELSPTICYLTEQHRQASGDALLDLLGAMRCGEVNEFHEMAVRERIGCVPAHDVVITKLYAHNVDVDEINQQHLRALQADTHRFTMTASGVAAKREQLAKSVLAPEILELKKGAEVMFVANNFPKGFVNGTRGTVMGFSGNDPIVLVGSKEIVVEPHTWSLEEDGRVRAEVSQYPLRLAWAITIHKSQGMSLDAAEIDLSRSFTPGMGYVALSRVRSMDGVFLQGINRMALQLHPLMFAFDQDLHDASEKAAEQVSDFEPPKPETAPIEDPLLFDELRQWRLDRAHREGVAPFMILHDATLHELATKKPQTEQAMRAIKGLGPTKIARFGADIAKIMKSTSE